MIYFITRHRICQFIGWKPAHTHTQNANPGRNRAQHCNNWIKLFSSLTLNPGHKTIHNCSVFFCRRRRRRCISIFKFNKTRIVLHTQIHPNCAPMQSMHKSHRTPNTLAASLNIYEQVPCINIFRMNLPLDSCSMRSNADYRTTFLLYSYFIERSLDHLKCTDKFSDGKCFISTRFAIK